MSLRTKEVQNFDAIDNRIQVQIELVSPGKFSAVQVDLQVEFFNEND